MVEAFGDRADDFVVVGSCALALYSAQGHELTATKDVDCVSLLKLMQQERLLAELSGSPSKRCG